MNALTFHRVAQKLARTGVPVLPKLIRKAARVLYTAYIPLTTEIGAGTVVGHGGLGILLHPRARIGRNCVISPMVVIGGREGLEGGAIIGNYVRIGAGVKIIGPVRIGDFAAIGANAVVTRDVAPGAVVAGIPARELRRMEEPVAEYEKSTGRRVCAEDRARAPSAPVSGRNRPRRSDAAASPFEPSRGLYEGARRLQDEEEVFA